MKNVAWIGESDARALSVEDIKKAGVDVKENMVFPRLQAVEVTNELAKALTENTRLFGRFAIVDDKDVEEGDQLDFSKLETPSTPEPAAANSGFEATSTASSASTTTPTATTGDSSTAGRSSRNAKADR